MATLPSGQGLNNLDYKLALRLSSQQVKIVNWNKEIQAIKT